jgi:hypothetical protein
MVRQKLIGRNSLAIIPITGGFGNQLFQFAFGVYLRKVIGQRVKFDSWIGKPRRTGEHVSLFNIELDTPIEVFKDGIFFKKLLSKSFGWNLYHGLKVTKTKLFRDKILKLITNMSLQLRFRSFNNVIVSRNLGLDNLVIPSKPAIFIGYFQTYIYASSPKVFETLCSIKPKHISQKYYELKSEILQTKPLLLHLRLTDYLVEEKFGVPSSSYYQSAIDKISREKYFSEAWVVSDDIDGALVHLDRVSANFQIVTFDQSGLSDVEVWDLMRYFSGYVISNSSFAWWAAFLRRDQEAPVYAPEPWFQGMDSPNELIPSDWKRLPSS